MTPRNRQIQSEIAKRSCKFTNDILEDHGDWLLVDISTSKHPECTMAVDADVWDRREGGRVRAGNTGRSRYIYAFHNIDGKVRFFHRQIMRKVDGLETDHIAHGSMFYIDNRRSNLRAATSSQNHRNRGICRNNKSGTSGVSWQVARGKWRSCVYVETKQIYLGLFTDINDAIAARKAGEEKYFGEYAFKSEAK